MHLALLVSVLASQYALYCSGLSFPWYPGPLSLLALAASALLSFALIGPLGLWYAVSAFLQELTMCSIACYLLHIFPVSAVVLLVVPVFVACHFLSLKNWKLKLLLVTLWGVASVVLFAATRNVYLIAALHTLFGAVLISRSFLYLPEAA